MITQQQIKPLDLNAQVRAWQESLDLRVKAQEIKRDTAVTYHRGALKFVDWVGDRSPTAELIREWKSELLRDGIKISSVNTWLAGLRSFFGWLFEEGRISSDPMQRIKAATRKGSQYHVREPLTDAEALRLLSQPDRTTPAGARDYAILCLMLYTAARTIEVHRANLEDLQTISEKMVLRVQGKGRDERGDMLVILEPVRDAIKAWLAPRGQDAGALFTSLSNQSRGERLSRRALRDIVKKHMDAAGIRGNKTTHSLRHAAITNAIRNNVPLQKVRGMSRHASLDTLMIYFHEVDRLEDPAESHIDYGHKAQA